MGDPIGFLLSFVGEYWVAALVAAPAVAVVAVFFVCLGRRRMCERFNRSSRTV